MRQVGYLQELKKFTPISLCHVRLSPQAKPQFAVQRNMPLTVRDFRLSPQYKWDLLSVGILLMEWQIRLSVSWQRTCPTFQGQAVQEELSFDFLTLETGLLSCPETRYETIIIGCVKSQERHRFHLTLRLTVLTLTGRQGKLLRSCFATSTAMEHATLFVTIWTPLAIKLMKKRFKLDCLYLVLKGYFIKHLFNP